MFAAMAHPTDDPLTVKLISPVSTTLPHHRQDTINKQLCHGKLESTKQIYF